MNAADIHPQGCSGCRHLSFVGNVAGAANSAALGVTADVADIAPSTRDLLHNRALVVLAVGYFVSSADVAMYRRASLEKNGPQRKYPPLELGGCTMNCQEGQGRLPVSPPSG